MITGKIDTLTVSRKGLVVGCVLHGPEDSWIRFVALEVPVSLFTYDLLQNLTDALDRERSEPLVDPALW